MSAVRGGRTAIVGNFSRDRSIGKNDAHEGEYDRDEQRSESDRDEPGTTCGAHVNSILTKPPLPRRTDPPCIGWPLTGDLWRSGSQRSRHDIEADYETENPDHDKARTHDAVNAIHGRILRAWPALPGINSSCRGVPESCGSEAWAAVKPQSPERIVSDTTMLQSAIVRMLAAK